ncbi:hypothetical protein DITRI_Ditri05aG0109700 [Diplodiscus trichospermus]
MLLVVTDVAARGIDIPLLDNVINWDFPPKPKIFVHRVGRAARAGWTGTAFCFVTSEDMPYLLDLHLFLSRPIRAAPTEEEVLQDMDGVMNKIDQAIANGETVYGRFPQKIIDLVSDRTKSLPARESIKRAKDLPREGSHPIFKNVLEGGELVALAFSECLKAFRPKQTILEAEGEATKSKHLWCSSSQWVDVMKRKRAIHEDIINLVHKQRSRNHVGKHMEAGLSVRSNEGFGLNRLDSAVLDLVADDSEGLQKKKSRYHWDKRSKKYVKLSNGERVTASGKVKTESGARVKAEKTGIYKKWKERSHKKVSLKGTINGENAEETSNSSGDYWSRGNGRKFRGNKKLQHSVPNAHVRSEIKDLEQVQKERKKKANKIAHMKGKANKNKFKKSGRSGKRGKSK